MQGISIHALREEGDQRLFDGFSQPFHISIHALREEGDLERQEYSFTKIKFLSTPSARRATLLSQICEDRVIISIHALREEGDPFRRSK